MDFYGRLTEIMTCDAGGRGLRVPAPDLAAVADTLLAADRVLILTGFPVLGADGAPHGETDGPIGAAEIACALARLGSRVWLATDQAAYPVLRAAASVYGADMGVPVCEGTSIAAQSGEVELVEVPSHGTDAFAKAFLRAHRITHLLCVERPGKGLCGHYCSMRGAWLDDYVADTDSFLADFNGVSVAVGDGGNELGMGKHRALIAGCVPHGDRIAARLSADHVLVSGVSNWWGAGLAALLSYRAGKNLLAEADTESRALSAVLRAGGLDGCSGRCEQTVDGLPLTFHLERRALVRALLEGSV